MATAVSLSAPPISLLLRRNNPKPSSLKPLSTYPNLSLSFTRPTLYKPRFISPVHVSHAESDWKKRSLHFRNRFLDLTRLGSVVETAAESFFKSEIREVASCHCRALVLSRVGYFIPLPDFDRRLTPNSYLSLPRVLCYVVPSLAKLRKEGLDGQEKIKSYMCVS